MGIADGAVEWRGLRVLVSSASAAGAAGKPPHLPRGCALRVAGTKAALTVRTRPFCCSWRVSAGAKGKAKRARAV